MRITALPCLCVDVFDGTDEIRPGGEELNFAVHASRFEDMEVVLLGVIGKDRYGEVILKSIEGMNIDSRFVRVDEHHITANNMTLDQMLKQKKSIPFSIVNRQNFQKQKVKKKSFIHC